MPLLDDIAASGGERLSEAAVRALISEASDLASERLPSSAEVDLIRPAFVRLTVAAPALAGATRGALGALLCSLSIGAVDQAQLDWLKSEATFEERRAAMHAATDAVRERTMADRERWDMILSAVQDIGLGLLTRALPFLLAAL